MEGPHEEEELDACEPDGRAPADLAHRHRACALDDPLNLCNVMTNLCNAMNNFVLTLVMTCDGFVMTCDQLCTYYTCDQLCINI